MGDPHFASVKLLSHLDGVDEATVATDKSPSGHAITFADGAELDTAVKKFGTASAKFGLGTDPDFASVVLLVDFDGVDASTTFTDDSNSAHPLTAFASAQVDTAQSKFGGASGLFDEATGDKITMTGSQTDFDFRTGDFTIEAFTRTAGGAGVGEGIFHRGGSGTGSFVFFVSGVLEFWHNAVRILNGPTNVEDSVFHHVAVSRASGTIRMYLDGVEESNAAFSNDITVLGNDAEIGFGTSSPNVDSWNGWIDELRVTKGVARYTVNFTPPELPFPRS